MDILRRKGSPSRIFIIKSYYERLILVGGIEDFHRDTYGEREFPWKHVSSHEKQQGIGLYHCYFEEMREDHDQSMSLVQRKGRDS